MSVGSVLFPGVGGGGLMSKRASDIVANGSSQLLDGDIPAVSTMVDSKGNTIAWLYSQRRFEVTSEQIADAMKWATAPFEDLSFKPILTSPQIEKVKYGDFRDR